MCTAERLEYFPSYTGAMNKLILIKAMKYELFYQLCTLTMLITPMLRVSTLRSAAEGRCRRKPRQRMAPPERGYATSTVTAGGDCRKSPPASGGGWVGPPVS